MERCLMRLEWGVVLGGRVADEAEEGGSGLLCPTGVWGGGMVCTMNNTLILLFNLSESILVSLIFKFL